MYRLGVKKGVAVNSQDGITVSHLNVRPSISILLLQLFFWQIITAVVVVAGYVWIATMPGASDFFLKSSLGIFLLLVVFFTQIILTTYAALEWINNYYEVTPDQVIHKRGIFFRKVERFVLRHVWYAEVEHGLWGHILNYGTITLYDQRRNKLMELYLIHNPDRYMEVLDKLNPRIDEDEHLIRFDSNNVLAS